MQYLSCRRALFQDKWGYFSVIIEKTAWLLSFDVFWCVFEAQNRNALHSLHKFLSCKVRVPAGGSNVRMPKQFLHLIQTSARVDQKRGKTVAKIVHPKVWQPCPAPGCMPAVVKRVVG